jgi:hypothetical protein
MPAMATDFYLFFMSKGNSLKAQGVQPSTHELCKRNTPQSRREKREQKLP